MTNALRGIGMFLLVAVMSIGAMRDARAEGAPEGTPTGDEAEEAVAIGLREKHVQLVPLKDANLAVILSIGTPGMGQFYVGEWQKGLAFLGGVAGSLVAVGLAADNLALSVEDYDKLDRSGNENHLVDVAEYMRWQDNPRRGFGDLSTGRKAVMIGGFGTALGLYVWNIIDARSTALEHNRRLYAELTGIRVSLGPDPRGSVRAQFTIAF